jgi:serine protease Do
MNGLVIRLAGVEQPETRVFHQETITIGTAPTCDLSFRAEDGMLPHAAALLALRFDGGTYRIVEFHEEARVLRDGEAVAVGEAIRDGDTVYFGTTGIRLRFFHLSPSMELAETLQLGAAVLARARAEHAVAESGKSQAAAPRTDVALVFVKQLLRELVAEIPRRVLYLALGLVLLVIGTIVYINTLSFLEGRRNNAAITDLKRSLGEVQQDLSRAREDIRKTSEESKFLLSTMSFAAQVVDKYGPGVCLIYGTYSYVDPRSGREARFREPTETSSPINPNGSVNLSVDGNGPIYELEFIGTGFLVSKGVVLTVQHVVEPWADDPVASLIRGQGYRARLKELYAYFPKTRAPFLLQTIGVGRAHDVALCSFEQGEETLPVLPLDEAGEGTANGQPVVLIGYPAGIEGLLAKTDEADRPGLLTSGRTSLRTLLNELAGRALISPYSTRGYITDLPSRKIAYDAQTSEGGSGGPVFGSNGKVIGINQAMLPGSPANFGVPIRYGLDLIKRYKPELEFPAGKTASASSAGNAAHP